VARGDGVSEYLLWAMPGVSRSVARSVGLSVG